ncbi:hypothetical protein DOTSEDRAFT_72633 [Dothistroma septosporum NZE10]|uniref:Uncharacterized protein n=1 Tax=Dothistroma septosporum (strain NZE10 / CBS 128990) TaxID=675120 RepID=M2XLG2_DOTSN|nr:hypothetical protein DOTSEDRAFT_72633 [Dothistroma septosporum NZE10]
MLTGIGRKPQPLEHSNHQPLTPTNKHRSFPGIIKHRRPKEMLLDSINRSVVPLTFFQDTPIVDLDPLLEFAVVELQDDLYQPVGCSGSLLLN